MLILTISDKQSEEPLVILGEDDSGMSVIGGDPRQVKALGLNQFSNLKEMEELINSEEDSDIKASFEEDAVAVGEEENLNGKNNADFDDRIAPCLDILKDLMAKVDARRQQEQSENAAEENVAEALATTESEIVMDKLTLVYLSYDGDNIGSSVQRAEEKDDEKVLAERSQAINSGQDVAIKWCVAHGGTMIEDGGDEGCMKVPSTALSDVEALRAAYEKAVGATLTVGIGSKISEAMKARELGKLTGKNKTVIFDENTDKELSLRLKDQDLTEANKIKISQNSKSISETEPVQIGEAAA